MKNYKPMTISQAEQSKDSSVWVMNTSDNQGSAKGIVNITIVEGNGRAAVTRVPVTFIPVDLTTQATKAAIMMSPDFRRLIAGKWITIISEEDALEALASPQAQQEQRRLLNIDQAHEVQENQQSPEVKNIMAEAAGGIGGLAMNIAHTDDAEDSVLSNLRNNVGILSQVELQYIVNTSSSHKVKAFAAENIIK